MTSQEYLSLVTLISFCMEHIVVLIGRLSCGVIISRFGSVIQDLGESLLKNFMESKSLEKASKSLSMLKSAMSMYLCWFSLSINPKLLALSK